MQFVVPVGKVCFLTEVRQAFHQTGYASLRQVEVVLHQDCIRIEGIVPTYYLKQMAQALALKVNGVNRVDNALRVS